MTSTDTFHGPRFYGRDNWSTDTDSPINADQYLTDDDIEADFREFLDNDGPVQVGPFEYEPSAALRAVDFVTYECGVIDWRRAALRSGELFEHWRARD